ncbi:MAG: zf-HC2 domain-containing protein [Lachnospiraceae bacterium]|nr:zf-HC2 domain-containing protein [Lachnospiraceae bacterium]
MRIDCEVMSDLLPLYVEDLTSEESNEIVREHLSYCGECREKYEKLKAGENIIEDDGSLLKKIAKKYRYNKIAYFVTVLFAITCLVTIGYGRVTFDAQDVWKVFYLYPVVIFIYSAVVGRMNNKKKYLFAPIISMAYVFTLIAANPSYLENSVSGVLDIIFIGFVSFMIGTAVSIAGMALGGFGDAIDYYIRRKIKR